MIEFQFQMTSSGLGRFTQAQGRRFAELLGTA